MQDLAITNEYDIRLWNAEDLIASGFEDVEQAEYAKMLLENDGLGDLTGLDRMDVESLIFEAVERVESYDGTIVFRAETRDWAF